jgi:uncharacterized protein (DUF952 family)
MGQSQEPDRAAGQTYHLTPQPVWNEQREGEAYLPEAFADEGFIHTTNDELYVLEVANRYYQHDPRPFVLLDVDLTQVRARTIYEDPAHRYPHVYGPIDRPAVTRVRRVERGPDGEFLRIGTDVE